MKIVTLNLQGFTNWEARQSKIVEYLRMVDADIIFFQEVVFIPDESPFNQVQLLNKSLGYAFENSAVTRLQPSPSYRTYREGLSVLSKHPIAKADTIVLQQSPGDEHNRIVQLVDIIKDGEVFNYANVHFSLCETVDYATPHLIETLEIIRDRQEERTLIGDFNLSDLASSGDSWSNTHVSSENTPYISFPGEKKRIDYFLAPKRYSIHDIEVSPDGLSDHRAVVAVVE